MMGIDLYLWHCRSTEYFIFSLNQYKRMQMTDCWASAINQKIIDFSFVFPYFYLSNLFLVFSYMHYLSTNVTLTAEQRKFKRWSSYFLHFLHGEISKPREGKVARKQLRQNERKGETLTSYSSTNVKYVLLRVTGKQDVCEEELRLV